MKVTSVSVYEDKKFKRIHGVTYYDSPGYAEEVQDAELQNILVTAEIGVSYAGLIAEKSLFKSISGSRQIPMFIKDGSADDNKSARELIKKYNLAPPGQKRTLYKQKVMREVQRDLHTHWDAITIVAHALFRRHRLNFDDLQTLLIKKSKNKKFWKEQFKNIEYFYDNCDNLDEKDLKSILL